MKKLILTTLLFTMTAAISTGCGNQQSEEETMGETNVLTAVTVNTTVRTTGQYPENFVLTFENSLSNEDISAEDFSMTGNSGYWGSKETRPFNCDFSEVTIDGNTLTLVPKDFPEKFFYVKDYEVTCSSDSQFNFTNEDITETITPLADDFETLTNTNYVNFDYHLYTPETTENMPVVIVFHGFSDTSNLLTYRTAVEWVEPENQSVRPCYVIAPVIDDSTYYMAAGRDKVFTALKEILDKMISEGKIDSNHIYVMGNSFGGMSTIEFAEKYPDFVTACMALCPALTYAEGAVDNLSQMKDVPIWFCHAAGDNTIPVSASQTAVSLLENMGAVEVHYTEYTDEEMNAAGADGSPDATYSYHHVELAVMEDDSYMEWMFSK